MSKYEEGDYLDIAGIQHFSFCRRQWSIIHIEQEWNENVLTVEGNIVHEKAHSNITEKRGNTLIVRGLEIKSEFLGAHGFCDVVEFRKNKNGVVLFGRDDLWSPIPVEYKRGKPKVNDADRLQLCTQAMCLEEMFHCEIEKAYLFYHEVNHREEVTVDSDLREKVIAMFEEMHNYYKNRYTPKVKASNQCKSCSLIDICVPSLLEKSAKDYIDKYLNEELL